MMEQEPWERQARFQRTKTIAAKETDDADASARWKPERAPPPHRCGRLKLHCCRSARRTQGLITVRPPRTAAEAAASGMIETECAVRHTADPDQDAVHRSDTWPLPELAGWCRPRWHPKSTPPRAATVQGSAGGTHRAGRSPDSGQLGRDHPCRLADRDRGAGPRSRRRGRGRLLRRPRRLGGRTHLRGPDLRGDDLIRPAQGMNGYGCPSQSKP